MAEGKNIFESEFKCKTLKEQEKHMVLKWSVISTNTQEYTKAIVSIIDLTKLKEVTEQIQDLSQLRESIIDNANVWLTVFDNDLCPWCSCGSGTPGGAAGGGGGAVIKFLEKIVLSCSNVFMNVFFFLISIS